MNTILRDWLLLGKGDHTTVADIALAVFGETGVGVGLMKSDRRDAETVTARHLVMFLSRELTSLSFPQIGRDMGGKDHSGVMHGYSRMAARLALNPELACLAERCRRRAMAISMGVRYDGHNVQQEGLF